MEPVVPVIVTGLLLAYAHFRQALTRAGLLAAAATAFAHSLQLWGVWLALLGTFFLAGTAVTKIKQAYKSTITASANPSPPRAPGQKPKAHPRTATQVFSNSAPASMLILIYTLYLTYPDYLYGLLAPSPGPTTVFEPHQCLISPSANNWRSSSSRHPPRSGIEKLLNTLPYAILALYSTAGADTFASELGILSQEEPLLLTDLFRLKITHVPRGTNGGITLLGVAASGLGACLVSGAFVGLIPLCSGQWDAGEQIVLALGSVLVGVLGALLDSILGAWCQASVVDLGSGKIVENEGGGKVIYKSADSSYSVAGKEVGRVEEKRRLVIGRDLLSNNGVNLATGLLMAAITTVTLLVLGG